jgi:hypothetical protein
LKVIYAPHKAFKEIIKNPKYLGPLLILIVFVAAETSFFYVRASKIYSEETKPNGLLADEWTENATLWRANTGVDISNNYVDFINGTPPDPSYYDYYGNSSVEFSVNNSPNVQMALSDLGGSVDCGPNGFKNLSLRIKIVSPEVKPENLTLYLYSVSDSNYFSYDLTGALSSSAVDVWNNITVPVGSGAWSSSNSAAKWENITSLRLAFDWSTNSSIKIRIDGLFFKGIFKSAIDIYGSQGTLINFALNAVTPFLFQWLLMTALIYIMIKGLKGNVTWKPVMVAVGFALVTLVAQALIMLAAYSTLSAVNVPLDYFAGVPGEFDIANQAIVNALEQVNLVSGAVVIAVYGWTFALGAFITREITAPAGEGVAMTPQFGWLKCLLVSAASFLLTLLILGFLLGV